MSAVNPGSGEFEFEAGTVQLSRGTVDSEAEAMTSRGVDRAPGGDIGTLGHRDGRVTVVGRWEDPVDIDVNKVLVAAQIETVGSDVARVECLYGWWWRTGTGWRHPGGDSEPTNCRATRNRGTATADGHFSNSLFPACIPDTVHVHYNNLWVTVTPAHSRSARYQWGIRDTWAEGARCSGLLKWSRYHVIQNEFSTGWIN